MRVFLSVQSMCLWVWDDISCPEHSTGLSAVLLSALEWVGCMGGDGYMNE